MIERLLRVDDDEMNEHKKLQLRELAALNGTLKDEQACYHCGEWGHRPMDCPKSRQEVYVLPEAMQSKVGGAVARLLAWLLARLPAGWGGCTASHQPWHGCTSP
jgi:splicing factor 1